MSRLAGKRVIVTRAAHQADAVVRLLAEHNAEAVLYPCIAIGPPADTNQLDAMIHTSTQFDWLILTSTNTVQMLKQRMDALAVEAAWSGVQVAAVGPKTAKLAERLLRVRVDCVPDEHTAEALAGILPLIPDAKVALPQSELANNTLIQCLSDSGADVSGVVAYRNVIGQGGDDVSGPIHGLTFTSGSTVRNFITRWSDEGRQLADVLDLPAACIGPVTGEVVQACGFSQVIVPATYTLPDMITALADHVELEPNR